MRQAVTSSSDQGSQNTVAMHMAREPAIPALLRASPDNRALVAAHPAELEQIFLQSRRWRHGDTLQRSGTPERVGVENQYLTQKDAAGHEQHILKHRYQPAAGSIRASDLAPHSFASASFPLRPRASAPRHSESPGSHAPVPHDLLAELSHEFRTPVHGIIGMMEMALRTPLSPDQREFLNQAKVSADALLVMVNDILDHSRINAGCLALERIDFSLHDCIADAVKGLALEAENKDIELVFDSTADLPDRVVGDPTRLRQVLINLLGNAIKFTEHGHIAVHAMTISQDKAEAVCHFLVRDSGIGIAQDRIESIFVPFAQAESATSRLYGGTGLGLSISRRLVRMMGGRMWVESTPGAGSVFHFTVRLGLRASSPLALRSALPRGKLAGLRVLIAEHRSITRRSLAGMLRSHEASVDEVADTRDALARIARARREGQPFDLVMADERLPAASDELNHDPSHEPSYELGHEPRRDLSGQQIRHEAGDDTTVVMLGLIKDRIRRGGHFVRDGMACLTLPVKPAQLVALALHARQRTPRDAALSTYRFGMTGVAPAPTLPPRPSSRFKKVLLVDDSRINSRVAAHILAESGFQISLEHSGFAALKRLEHEGFDLVLMDLQLPGMDGIETAELMRQREKPGKPRLPIIALSAHEHTTHRARCLAAGMDGYLVKPLRAEALDAALEGLKPQAEAEAEAAARVDPAPCPAPPMPATALPIIDWTELLERIGDDRELLAECATMLREHGTALWNEGAKALQARDEKQFAYTVHTLNGMFRSLAAHAAGALAEQIQAALDDKDWNRIDADYAKLAAALDRLNTELSADMTIRS